MVPGFPIRDKMETQSTRTAANKRIISLTLGYEALGCQQAMRPSNWFGASWHLLSSVIGLATLLELASRRLRLY